MAPKIILASASPARYKLLQSAGITPEVIVSGVDEESSDYQNLSPKELVIALAIVKAHTVREKINYPALIIGCDSTFEFQGQSLGKPGSAANAIAELNNCEENLEFYTPDIALLILRKKLKLAM